MMYRQLTGRGGRTILLLALFLGLAAGSVSPVAGEAPPPSKASHPSSNLRALLEEVLEHNPEIQAARRDVDAKRVLVRSQATLPDPMVRFETMGNLIPPTLQSGDPSSARLLSIEQEIPYPGKLGLKGSMARAEAEGTWWTYEQTRRNILSETKEAYYDLCFAYESLDVVKRNKTLLESFGSIAEARYEVGQGNQQDILRAQVEVSRILDRLTLLELELELAQARINSLRFQPPSAPLGRPEPIRKADLKHSLEELYQIASSSFPPLKRDEREIDRSQYAVQLARRELYPDFSIGFAYFNRASVPEMYGLMFGARLPLYFWRKQRPELEGAASSLVSAEKKRDSTKSLLYLQLKEGHASAMTAQRLLDLYEGGLIPQARLSLESAVANYQVGKLDFLTIIDAMVTLLDYELKYQETLTDYQKSLARLEPLVGIELTD